MGARSPLTELDAADRAACTRILAHSFGRPEATYGARFWRAVGRDLTVLRAEREVAALAVVRERAAAFAGRFVQAACVGSVCVDPRLRARGHGSALLVEILRSACARGIGVALLTTENERLYQNHGFVRGGARFECELELPRNVFPSGSPAVRVMQRADESDVARLARDCAQRGHGFVLHSRADRRRRSAAPRRAYVLEQDGAVTGFLVCSQRVARGRMTLFVHEFLAREAHAARDLWAFVARHGAQVRSVRLRADPADPQLEWALEHDARFVARGPWLARLAAVRTALEQRGYARAFRGTLAFALSDPLLPDNERPFTLSIAQGRGRTKAVDAGSVRCDVASLTRLFVGAAGARRLYAEGKIAGPEADLATLDAAFATGACSLPYLP